MNQKFFAPLFKAKNTHMKTITFIRHGQSTANTSGITMAHDAIPLSERGKAQAQALANALDLQPAVIVVSEYLRLLNHFVTRCRCSRWFIHNLTSFQALIRP